MNEELKRCSLCGLCKENCPVFSLIIEETVSPRGKSILLKKEVFDKVMYMCSLCKACEKTCPANVKLTDVFKEARANLVQNGAETEKNKEMIKNIREFGNPFGKMEKDKKIKDLFCC